MTVLIIGAGTAGLQVATELLAAGVTDFEILDKAPFEDMRDMRGRGWPAGPAERVKAGCDVVGSVFDDDTDTWTLRTGAGETFQARVVIAAHRGLFAPWIPAVNKRNDFRGVSFHAADWDPDFDAAGKRVAVVGTDATAGYYLGRLKGAQASVTVFAQAPRWVVMRMSPWVPLRTVPALRWLRDHTRPPSGPSVVQSAIEALTPAGIRTGEGVEHHADAIVFGTGFRIADGVSDEALVGAGGLTIRQVWHDGMEPYLGLAVHGFPNYFFLTGPDISRQARYVADCVKLLQSTGRTRIEVLRSSQQVFNERAHLEPAP
ncbi:MAG: hypothetical protein QOH91_2635, partial [Mycobacterium sp.]|nr:hypothetical protein [Mycobacterium sp.]